VGRVARAQLHRAHRRRGPRVRILLPPPLQEILYHRYNNLWSRSDLQPTTRPTPIS
jgi:hypothetical protein